MIVKDCDCAFWYLLITGNLKEKCAYKSVDSSVMLRLAFNTQYVYLYCFIVFFTSFYGVLIDFIVKHFGPLVFYKGLHK